MFAWLFNRSKRGHLPDSLLRQVAGRIAAAPFEVNARLIVPLPIAGGSLLNEARRLNVVGELRLWALVSCFHALHDLKLGLSAAEQATVMRDASKVFCERPMFSQAELDGLPGQAATPELQLYDMAPSRSMMVQSRYDWCSALVEQSRNDPGRIPPAITLQIFKWTMIEQGHASGGDIMAINLAALTIRQWATKYVESTWRELRV